MCVGGGHFFVFFFLEFFVFNDLLTTFGVTDAIIKQVPGPKPRLTHVPRPLPHI